MQADIQNEQKVYGMVFYIKADKYWEVGQRKRSKAALFKGKDHLEPIKNNLRQNTLKIGNH